MRKPFSILGTGIVTGLATGAIATPASAQTMSVSVEIPRLRVAEYHNPYVAIWIEDAAGKAVTNLDIWYDTDLRGDDPTKWLPDLRTWWRRTGRTLKMPVNGVSGPTQPPGRHTVNFKQGSRPLGNLRPGSYKLRVEAAREVGGREVLSVPFQWPPKGSQTASAKGTKELGTVRLTIKP